MKVAEFLVSIVEGLGAEVAFSLTGGMAMHLNRAVAASGLRVVYGNHEQACVAAADGYARVHDHQRPGLAIVTSGPGVTNIITALASAYHDSVPLVVLAGQVKTADLNRFGVRSHGAQEVPSLDLTAPVAKRALRYTPATISDEELAEVFGAALSGRMGPVFIEVPLDVQPVEVPGAATRRDSILREVQRLRYEAPTIPAEVLDALRTQLHAARQPVLFVGNGARLAGIARERIRSLAEQLGAPVLTTWPSAGYFGADHPLHFGCPGGLAPTHSNRILQAADLILFLGVRADVLTTAFAPERFGKHARRYFIEVDPREAGKFPAEAGVVPVMAELAASMAQLEATLTASAGDPAWLAACRQWRDEDAAQEAQAFAGVEALNARAVGRAMAQELSGVALVTTASGYAIEGLARFFAPRAGCDMLYAGHCLGSMGLGLPTAIGAAAAAARPVICVEGDGGIMLNIQELLTLQANPGIALPILILNNRGYLSIARSQRRAFADEFGASDRSGLALADFRRLAPVFGYQYRQVRTVRGLRRVLRALMAHPGERVLVDVMLGGDDYRGPAVTTRFREDGTPYSSELEEVNWTR